MSSLLLNDQTVTAAKTGDSTSAIVIGTQEWGSVLNHCHINAAGADWGAKLPGNRNSVFNDCVLTGGKKRALDAVQGGNIAFNRCAFSPGTDRPVTTSKWSLRKTCDIGLKGGLDGAAFNQCEMADLLLGDFSIYNEDRNLPKTRNVVLTDCVHPLGAHVPIVIRCIDAERPKLVNTNAVIISLPSLFVAAYFTFCRHFGDTRAPVVAAAPAS